MEESFSGSAMKVGDGYGGFERYIGLYTIEQCLTEVKKRYPDANGMTVSHPCRSVCKCYAEFNMSKWSGSRRWQSCIFKSGNHMEVFGGSYWVEFLKASKVNPKTSVVSKYEYHTSNR